jgi:DNA helicase-2/ATP-dependent DNA helicase PcrA
MISATPRPSQEKILSYQNGTMGVIAVPGSGKTWTLSMLAVELIQKGFIDADQEILVVTLVNSAVNQFSQRISAFLNQRGLIPSLGYRVRTLHGLAHDIITERPDLVGLDNNFLIIDEREAARIRASAVADWLRLNPGRVDNYLLDTLSEFKKGEVLQKQLPDLLGQLSLQFIRTAKDKQLSPSQLEEKFENLSFPLPLAEIGYEVYTRYQRDLNYRGAVDFDDLIRFALKVLELDTSLLKRLQTKWPYILEDEAQDSSLMQERILARLAGGEDTSNWVRVGDPNQAIYETFTTADPELLINFSEQANLRHSLPNSGRSTRSIISLANYLAVWSSEQHPERAARNALLPTEILPTPDNDVQSNPKDNPDQIFIHMKELSPAEEIETISISVKRWLKEHPNETAAVLVPRNQRGKKIVSELLSTHDIEAVEMLNSTLTTRKTSGALVHVMSYLAHPLSSKNLALAYKVWKRDFQTDDDTSADLIDKISAQIARMPHPEQFTHSGPDLIWQNFFLDQSIHEIDDLSNFRKAVIRWQNAVLLPVDQLVLSIAADLFSDVEELAISHKLSVFLKQLSLQHPDWSLPDFADELKVLAKNERRFHSFTRSEGFNPDAYQGKVVVTTAHKAKGLEWDRVYLVSTNNYNYPSSIETDSFISERWFINDRLNLPAEALAELNCLASSDCQDKPVSGKATQEARLDYIRERLRLLYVGITRARKELVITWNSGRRKNCSPALALQALSDYWDEHSYEDGKA